MSKLLTRIYGRADRALMRLLNRLRLLRLRLAGAEIAAGVRILGRVVVIGDASKLQVGLGSTLNEGVILELRDRITIGARVHISSGCRLHTGRLPLTTDAGAERTHTAAPIMIEDGVWLASGTVVGAGVNVGARSVVAANSVVLQDVPANRLAAGAPARELRTLVP